MFLIKRLAEILLLSFLLFNISNAQPIQRSGWPVEFSTPGPFIQNNGTSWIVNSEGKVLIGLASQYAVNLYDIDGNQQEGWPFEFGGRGWYGSNGPRFGDVVGDGEYEVVVLQRDYYASRRRLIVKELDGTPLQHLCREYGEESFRPKLSPVVLKDLNNDGTDEILFTADSLHILHGDGSDYPGYPATVDGKFNVYSGVVYVPANIPHGDVLIYSSDTLLIAKGLHSTTDFTPWSVNITDSTKYNTPIVIPRENDWVLALTNQYSLKVWDYQGNMLDGFPVPTPPLEANMGFFDISASDGDGDGSPEILLRKGDGMLRAVNLNGEVLPGYPVGEIWNDSDGVLSLRIANSTPALLFYASYFDRDRKGIWAMKGNDIIDGFPLEIIPPNPLMAPSASIIWRPNNDTLHLVFNNNNGFANVWDWPMPGRAVRLEWPMPGCNAGGNRVYKPSPYMDAPEKSESNNLPDQSSIKCIYPNPANSGVIIEISNILSNSGHLQIFNLLGRLVWQSDEMITGTKTESIFWPGVNLKGQSVPSGQYFVTLENNKSHSQSVVILR